MTQFLVLLINTVVSALDPISLTGYVLAGTLQRRYWLALAIAEVWAVLLMVAFGAPSGASAVAGRVLGAMLAVSVAFAIARLVKSRASPQV